MWMFVSSVVPPFEWSLSVWKLFFCSSVHKITTKQTYRYKRAVYEEALTTWLTWFSVSVYLRAFAVLSSIILFTSKVFVTSHTCPGSFVGGCYCYCVARGLSLHLLLTQTEIVVEKSEEVIALFPVVATRCAGAPGSHVGCGVVKVVWSYCASCRGEERGKQQSSLYLQANWSNTTPHITRFTTQWLNLTIRSHE